MVDLYENMWQNALPFLKNGNVKTDPFLFSNTDTRRGMTLLFRAPSPVLKNIETFLNKARQFEPDQYFYPISEIHLTVLSIISCYPDFDASQIESQAYLSKINIAIKQIPPFQLTFRGLTASPGTVMIQGFDESGHLNRLRQLLREKLRNSSLEHGIDKRYKIQTAHMTAIRFAHPLANPNAFLKLLEAHRNMVFATCEVHELELVFNDWYHRKEKVKSLGSLPISG